MSTTDTQSWRHHRARVARAERYGDREAADAARQDLKFVRAEDYARELVSTWPPLTSEQRERIAAILRPSTVGGGDGDG